MGERERGNSTQLILMFTEKIFDSKYMYIYKILILENVHEKAMKSVHRVLNPTDNLWHWLCATV